MKRTLYKHFAQRSGGFKYALLAASLMPMAAMGSGSVTIAGDALGANPQATLTGRLDAQRSMTIAVLLPLSDAAGAHDFATRVSTPGDELSGQYLTPDAYAKRFGASTADYAAVVAWAKANGLTPGEEYPAHTVVPITGSAGALEAALGVRFNTFRTAQGTSYFAADRAASLPEELAAKVSGVVGLSSAAHFVPFVIVNQASKAAAAQSVGHSGFSAKDLRTIYQIQPQALPNQTQTLAVFEQGGFYSSDVVKYVAANRLPMVPVVPRSVNNYGTGVDDPGVELEAVLDIDMIMAMNPAAAEIMVYEDGSDSFPVALLSSFSAMAKDDKAKTISVSYGVDEDFTSRAAVAAENDALTQLAAQGQAVFVSTGDRGAYGYGSPSLHTTDPSTQPFVTAVGGTTLFVGPKNKLLAQEVWNDLPGFGATGGGVSTYWPIQSYQRIFTPARNGGSKTMRNTPDVSAVASPLTGVAVFSALQGGWITVGGTSVSAPIWAGVYSLGSAAALAMGFPSPGFANPILYKIAAFEGLYPGDLVDIYDGNNGDTSVYGAPGYSAGAGYDNASGLGSINGGDGLVADIGVVPALFHSWHTARHTARHCCRADIDYRDALMVGCPARGWLYHSGHEGGQPHRSAEPG